MNLRIFTIGCILLFAAFTQAQFVGIGTLNPQYPLDVRNSASGTLLGLRTVKDSIGASTLIRFTTTALNFLNPDDKSSYLGNMRSGSGSNLVFGTASNGNHAVEKMRLNFTGNLGLGTINPAGKVHIDLTESAITNAIIIDNDDQESTIQFQQKGTDYGFLQSTTRDLRIGTNAGNDAGLFAVRTNGLNRIIVNSAGLVGIGSTIPQAQLHVAMGLDASAASNGFLQLGPTAAANLVLDNNEILARDNGAVSTLFLGRDGSMVQIGNSTLTPGTKLYVTSGSALDLTDANSGFMVLGSVGSTNLVMDNNELQARNNGAASSLWLQHKGGNVRIGDADFLSSHRLGVTGDAVVTGNLRVGTTPLPAGYTFGVDGRIICTEVMVRLVNNWPDYVFNKNYPLRSLADLDKFVKTNHHLPGIPNAKTMQEQGLSLGEMQKLQMEKIEELTLYILELKKEIDSLKNSK